MKIPQNLPILIFDGLVEGMEMKCPSLFTRIFLNFDQY